MPAFGYTHELDDDCRICGRPEFMRWSRTGVCSACEVLGPPLSIEPPVAARVEVA